jgi:hypothetical protein
MTFESAQPPQPATDGQTESRRILTIGLIILAIVVAIGLVVCLCLAAPFFLALLGPAVGNVFSNIILNI